MGLFNPGVLLQLEINYIIDVKSGELTNTYNENKLYQFS